MREVSDVSKQQPPHWHTGEMLSSGDGTRLLMASRVSADGTVVSDDLDDPDTYEKMFDALRDVKLLETAKDAVESVGNMMMPEGIEEAKHDAHGRSWSEQSQGRLRHRLSGASGHQHPCEDPTCRCQDGNSPCRSCDDSSAKKPVSWTCVTLGVVTPPLRFLFALQRGSAHLVWYVSVSVFGSVRVVCDVGAGMRFQHGIVCRVMHG